MLPMQGAQGYLCGGGLRKQEEEGARESGEGSPEEDQDSGDGGMEFFFKRCNSSGTQLVPATHS